MTIHSNTFLNFDAARVPSPCFVVDEVIIEKNLTILNQLQQDSGAKVLIALKAFSMFSLAPLITRYLSGCCTSGLHEATLAYEHFSGNKHGTEKREVHVYSPAFSEQELVQLCDFADHIVFNSLSQWQRFQSIVRDAQQKRPTLSCGLRINPMLSLGHTEMYDPCAKGSRLGINVDVFNDYITQEEGVKNAEESLQKGLLSGIHGLHFHTLCEQGFTPLLETLTVIEEQFSDVLPHLKWLNFGGGHHITDESYDIAALTEKIKHIQNTYQLQVYLEPGEAIAIHSGVLVSEVMDLPENQLQLAIVDSSATCHMPDTLEMPYRADMFISHANSSSGLAQIAAQKGQQKHNYRFGGQTCLAGDVMGDYSFPQPLTVGQRLMFDDMAHYTMVKTSTFNGMPLPSIAIWNSDSDQLQIIKQFDYQDFLNRLS